MSPSVSKCYIIFTAFRQIAERKTVGVEQNSSHPRWRDGAWIGNISVRPGSSDPVSLGRIPLCSNRQVRWGPQIVCDHQHAGDQETGRIVPPNAGTRSMYSSNYDVINEIHAVEFSNSLSNSCSRPWSTYRLPIATATGGKSTKWFIRLPTTPKRS